MPRKSKVAEAILDVASTVTKKRAAKRAEVKLALGKMFKPLARAESNVTETIPTGIEALDRHVLGIGGWPIKRVIELFGDVSAGKTSLVFGALASVQRAGGIAMLIETEDALQVARARVFGCDVDEVYLSEPSSFEEVIEGMRDALTRLPEGVGPNVLAWDSLAMSSLQDIVEHGMASKSMGKKAKFMSEQLPPIAKLCRQKRTAMLIVNQTRNKIGVVFGNPTTTPGGEAHKFAASVRVQLWAGKAVKVGDRTVGTETTIRAIKNKVGVPHRKIRARLLFEGGWDDHWTTLNFAKDLGVVDKGLKLTEANYALARSELGWPGEGAPFTAPVLDVQAGGGLTDDDDDGEYR